MLGMLRATIATAGALVFGNLLPSAAQADGLGGFYTPPEPLAPYCQNNGDIIRDEPASFIVPTQVPFSVRRIMYCSRDVNNQRMAVTGTVLTPALPWFGLGPRPIVGFAVGTQGVGDQCAPSYQLQTATEYESAGIAALLTAGYGVTVTDYQGLGTPGIHTYLAVRPEAHAVLDSIRAAQRLPSANLPDAGPVGIFGYSQGGGASAAAAERQPSYAPELKLKGVYAGAVPANLQAASEFLDGTLATGFLLYGLHGINAAYPGAGIMGMLNAAGLQAVNQVLQECTATTVALHAFVQSSTLTNDGRSFPAHFADEFAAQIGAQRIGLVKPTAPVYMIHSIADDIVAYPQGRQLALDWCALGAKVQFETQVVPGHVPTALVGVPLGLAYMQQRFAGLPAPSNCGRF